MVTPHGAALPRSASLARTLGDRAARRVVDADQRGFSARDHALLDRGIVFQCPVSI